jgi:hypothetical protein
MLIGGTGVRVIATRAETEAWMKSLWARLKERGFARASKFSPLHIKQVSTSAAVASVRFARYDANGQEVERIGATYILHKTGAEWKIVVIVTHDPGGVLRLD